MRELQRKISLQQQYVPIFCGKLGKNRNVVNCEESKCFDLDLWTAFSL